MGNQIFKMKTDERGRGSVKAVGALGDALQVSIRRVQKILENNDVNGGIKMTVLSSYSPDIAPLLKKTLEAEQFSGAQRLHKAK